MTSSDPADLRVAVFVATRADLGPLGPVIEALAAAPDVRLTVLTGVGHSAESLAALLPGRAAERVVQVAPVLDVVDAAATAQASAALSRAVPEALRADDVQVLVVLGDRWELVPVVMAAVLLGVRVVHLHGGEVTEGALDERVRHAVTKLADQHCVASPRSAQRVRQLGEQPERVHVTGAPGLDRLRGGHAVDDGELARWLGVPVRRPLALFTYHPPTAEPGAPVGRWAREALQATLEACGTVVVTHPGVDPGREEVLAAVQDVAAGADHGVVVEALGARYPQVLRSVDVVVGNSSSGIIEAASVGVPAVDVGARQQGRERGANVVTVDEGSAAVAAGLREALSPEHADLSRHAPNPYGDGEAASRVLRVVRRSVDVGRAKPFVDLGEGSS